MALLSDLQNSRFFSAASIWEIAIKSTLGRSDFKVDPKAMRDRLLTNGYGELAVTSTHGISAARLHFAHKDPFDRVLLAQAREENMFLVSADARLVAFGPPVIAV